MKSRVTIDVDEDNHPVLKLEYIPSDDVRDKLAKKFIESFGSASAWSRTTWQHVPDAPVINNTIIVRPISPTQLEEQAEEMRAMFDIWKDRDPSENKKSNVKGPVVDHICFKENENSLIFHMFTMIFTVFQNETNNKDLIWEMDGQNITIRSQYYKTPSITIPMDDLKIKACIEVEESENPDLGTLLVNRGIVEERLYTYIWKTLSTFSTVCATRSDCSFEEINGVRREIMESGLIIQATDDIAIVEMIKEKRKQKLIYLSSKKN